MKTQIRNTVRALTFVLSFLPLSAASGFAQETLYWNKPAQFDNGVQSQAAMNSSRMVVEVHKSPSVQSFTLYYRVGRLTDYGQSVTWGKSQLLGEPDSDRSQFPTVALTNDNLVIVVYADGISRSHGRLHYRVGRIEPSGPVDQSIQWLTDDQKFDDGYHPNISVNSHGVIVETHEEQSGSGLLYRVGHLENPAQGKYNIVWTGPGSVRYDAGVNPHISINNSDQVVEMHQSKDGENNLHYLRGTVQPATGTITFGKTQTYSNKGYEPAVLLTDRDNIVGIYQNATIRTDVGIYNAYDPSHIWWKASTPMRDSPIGHYPGLGANSQYIISTWQQDGKLFYATAHLL